MKQSVGRFMDGLSAQRNPACSRAAENNSLGFYFGDPLMDTIYVLTFPFSHTDDTLALDTTSLGLQARIDKSWDLDNFKMTVSAGASLASRIFLPMMLR